MPAKSGGRSSNCWPKVIAHCPLHLNHTGQDRCLGEMAAEKSQVGRDHQVQVQFTVDGLLVEYFRLFGPWRHEQGLNVRLRQLALGIEGHLPQ